MSGIVVVGAGQAGASLVARLRALGHDGRITLIGAEPLPPYQRPPLSKAYLKGEMALERLFLRPQAFYSDNDIDLRLGRAVTALEPVSRSITLDGERIGYDHLVLATGAVPRRLPPAAGGDLPGVHVLRDVADADALAPELAAGRRMLVVGGGYIGLEVAAVAATIGMQVTLVEAAPRILQRVAAPETADYFRDLHHSRGVRILEGAALARLYGDGRLEGAELSDGTRIDADCAVVGVGVAPATTLAEAAGIPVENGIATDAYGRTGVAGIWAAGDCASFPWQGGRIRLESVQNAIDHAETVAANLLGADTPYEPLPWFWSDQYDVKLQIAGLNTGHDLVTTRQTDGARSHWYHRNGRLIAVDAMNDARAFMIAKRLLAEGRPADPAAIADPGFDLRALMRG